MERNRPMVDEVDEWQPAMLDALKLNMRLKLLEVYVWVWDLG